MSGRPTKKQQKTIRKKISELLCQGFSPQYVIQKTGYNKDTVYKYSNELSNLYDSSDDVEKIRHAITITSLSLDKQLEKIIELEKQVDEQIKQQKLNRKTVDRQLFLLKSRLIQQQMDILDKKASHQLQYSSDNILENLEYS